MGEIDIVEHQLAQHEMPLLKLLLIDKTTGSNIRWGTDTYAHLGEGYQAKDEILISLVASSDDSTICPRAVKSIEERQYRTRKRGEVFTPAWVCNEQNNRVDEEWFGGESPFNRAYQGGWDTFDDKILFPEGRTWKDYVDRRVLEITCGEGPYLASRYDSVTGELIPLHSRIGLLDRKLRVVSENASDENEWKCWAQRAVEATYGFDYQGDNVLLARENLLSTYIDYYSEKMEKTPSTSELHIIANRLAWNIWQMDGYTFTAPFSEHEAEHIQTQLSLFKDEDSGARKVLAPMRCKVYNWRRSSSEYFDDCVSRWNSNDD